MIVQKQVTYCCPTGQGKARKRKASWKAAFFAGNRKKNCYSWQRRGRKRRIEREPRRCRFLFVFLLSCLLFIVHTERKICERELESRWNDGMPWKAISRVSCVTLAVVRAPPCSLISLLSRIAILSALQVRSRYRTHETKGDRQSKRFNSSHIKKKTPPRHCCLGEL